ncbi:hypothetical protein ACUH7Y_06990 [Clostridium beijerinckii]|uniref:Uncharacterized protein n=1 Tax=Clostridium beijerinckii TaxID=1520 RepID=A0A7X9SQK3_CLOBE|nr:hypothetical protein [Clostridium beijerinckii]NMF06276.1 hypothetical protein [Clostridium beijerinckii]
MESLIELKKKYNALLVRDRKATEYLKTHTFAQCSTPLKNKYKAFILRDGGMWLDTFGLFNELVADLSKTKHDIETLLYRDMTDEEIWNGFKV